MSECVFCQIVRRQAPAELLHRDDYVIAFRDKFPRAPIHVLVIPTKHIASLDEADAGDQSMLAAMLQAAQQIAEQQQVSRSGYRLVINTGPDAGQSVSHLHLHLLGGRRMAWPPG
jgi:histidine triad (HIT) family protein